jgi:hypothetical protein
MATCTFSTTIKDYQERPLSGVRFFVKVHSGVVSGTFVQPTEFNVETNWRGVVRFPIIQGASVTISANHPSWATPSTITVPSQSAYDLANIADLSTGTVGTSFTVGSVLFVASGGLFGEDNANLFWDDTANALGLGTATPAASAILDLTSTSRGFLPPRMTSTQRDAISSPATGLTIFNTTTGAVNVYSGAWAAVGGTPPAGSGTELQYKSGSVFGALTGSSVSAGNLTLTGNLTAPLLDKGGNVYNLRAYIVDDGATDNSAAILALIAALSTRGGIIDASGCLNDICISSLITLGNGSSSAVSTRHNIVIRGASGHKLNATGAVSPTTFKWTGASGAARMFYVAGPIGGVRFEHLLIDCNDLANTGIDSMSAEGLMLEDVKVINNRDWGIKVDNYASGATVTSLLNDKADAAVLRQVYVNSTIAGSKGVQIAATGPLSQIKLDGVRITCQTGSNVGVEFGFADNCTITQLVTNATIGVRVKPVSGALAYPQNIYFYSSAIVGGVTIDESAGTWAPTNNSGLMFLPYATADSETVPYDARIWGMTDNRTFLTKGQPYIFRDTTATAFSPAIRLSTTQASSDPEFQFLHESDNKGFSIGLGGGVSPQIVFGYTANTFSTRTSISFIDPLGIWAVGSGPTTWNNAVGQLLTSAIIGTTTNDSAAAGMLGQYIEASAAVNTVSLTSSTAKTITSISLTAGDWDVTGLVYYRPAASTTVSEIATCISLTNNTLDLTPGKFADQAWFGSTFGGVDNNQNVPVVRLSLASTTTVYLVGYANFGTSTMTAGGHLGARRVR